MAEETKETFVRDFWEYQELEDGTVMITGYTANSSEVAIPAELDGKKVTAIKSNPFKSCFSLRAIYVPEELTSIFALKGGVLFSKADKRLICYPNGLLDDSYEIPQGIEIIGDYAFYKCYNLTTITIPDSVTEIGSNPFAGCSGLESVEVSSDHPVIDVQNGAIFSKNDNRLVFYPSILKDEAYVIPDGTAIIGAAAFQYCDAVRITIPESVISIGEYAFADCSFLTEIVLPDSLTSISDHTFIYCNSLPEITIPENVTSIGEYAFYGCSCLAEITFPEGLTYIGDNAFGSCMELSDVILSESISFIGTHAFTGCNGISFIVKYGSYAEQFCRDINYRFIYPDTENDDWLSN